MSKYSLEYCTDRELPEWLVVKDVNSQQTEFDLYGDNATEADYV